MNIERKHIELDTSCPVCLRCKAVKKVWRELNLEEIRVALLECPNPHAMFELLWTKPMILLYNWWSARKKPNVGDKAWTTEEVCF
jgi:hypothetical protein